MDSSSQVGPDTQGLGPQSGVVYASQDRSLKDEFRLPLHFSERRVLLGSLDLLAINAGLLIALSVHPKHEVSWQLIADNPLWLIVLSGVWLPAAHAFDAYHLQTASRFDTSASAVLKASIFTTVIYLLIPYITPQLPSSRMALYSFVLSSVLILVAERGIYAFALSQPRFRRRTLIIGAGWAGRTIAEVLDQHNDDTFRIVGFIDDDPTKQGTIVAGKQRDQEEVEERSSRSSTPYVVVGNRQCLSDLVRHHGINTLILAITHEVHDELLQVLMDALEHGAEIIPMPVLYEQLTGKVLVEHVGRNWHVAVPIYHPGAKPLNQLLKRLSDIILASLGIACLAPVFPFLAVAIYLDSPGPVFYTQRRVGQGGKIFLVYKFRSMIPNAELDQAVWAQEGDPRITRVGRILRATHVDEFPQFLNVLKGEMSAVGPRPERPEFADELAQEIPFYRVRHAVKPGMAGWALVKQGYGASKVDALLKLQYDLYYIKHQSLWLDLVILLKTTIGTIALKGR